MKRCPDCMAAYASEDWNCPVCGFIPPVIDGFHVFAPGLNQGDASFPSEAFSQLATLEAGNFWFRARNKLIIWALRSHFPKMRHYLEVGCGTGYVLANIANTYPQATLTGSEISSVGLPYAALRVEMAELIQMDARRIPYVEEFDVIGAFDVLEHIEEDEAVLSEMLSALRPGGGVILTVPQHPWLWSKQDKYACHVRRYQLDELRKKVEQAGFKVEFETSFVSLLLPAMLVSRLIQKHGQPPIDPMTELRLPKLLNHIFEVIMNLERQIIHVGVRFTLGGSRLLIARKNEVTR